MHGKACWRGSRPAPWNRPPATWLTTPSAGANTINLEPFNHPITLKSQVWNIPKGVNCSLCSRLQHFKNHGVEFRVRFSRPVQRFLSSLMVWQMLVDLMRFSLFILYILYIPAASKHTLSLTSGWVSWKKLSLTFITEASLFCAGLLFFCCAAGPVLPQRFVAPPVHHRQPWHSSSLSGLLSSVVFMTPLAAVWVMFSVMRLLLLWFGAV